MHIEIAGEQNAQHAFSAESLPWPPVPPYLATRLQRCGPHAFATRPMASGLYDVSPYLREVLEDPGTPDYAAAGFDGYGFNSWTAAFFLVQRSLGLFIQVPWGGAFVDADASRIELARLFEWSGRLLATLASCEAEHRLPAGRRLVIVASQRASPGWAWVDAPAMRREPLVWNPAGQMLAAIDRSLEELLAHE